MPKDFPIFNHEGVICYHCGVVLHETPVDYGYPPGSGQWKQKCWRCGHVTFYDLPNQAAIAKATEKP
jgi:transcription initiation factor TFIIIB Brf1 subunit/transcription initiation factor TFIIB